MNNGVSVVSLIIVRGLIHRQLEILLNKVKKKCYKYESVILPH